MTDATQCQKIVESIGWLGETWGFWIQTGAFFLSALAAVAVIYYNGKQSRVNALINLITQQKSDQSFTEATRTVHALNPTETPLAVHVNNDGAERKAILLVLNNHEFIAVGVRLGAFDENVYKELQCTNVIRLYDNVAGFIQETRRIAGKDTLFQDFEALAKRWKKNPIRKV